MTPPHYLLGLDLGGTSVKAVAVTPDGERLAKFHTAFDLAKPMAFATAVSAATAKAAAQLGRPERIGLSAPGIAARDGRAIAFMPGRFEGLEGLVWAEYLERTDGVPVLNDANAALLGEVWLGAARGARNVILLTLGTGVGGAAMVDGRLLRGHTGKAGHLGHVSLNPDAPPDICRTPGSLESAIGNFNISERAHGHFATTHGLIHAHEQGDAFATEVWLKSVKALAAAIASFGNVLDPEVAIIGGGIARSGETLFRPLRAFLDDMEWRAGGAAMRLVPARLGDLAGAYGAAFNARSTGE
ncbi:MAG: ROK family protein [Verrucomicrobiales bacterium]|nr:ROK family protein [Verrucomicrobiales bacterium]